MEVTLVIFVTIFYYLTLPMDSKRVVYIPKGSTSNAISYLNQNGYSLNFIDRVTLFFIGYPQSGWVDMGKRSEVGKITKLDFLYKIATSKAALATVVLIPGETYYFFLNELSQKLKLPKDELFKVYYELAYKKDGNIMAQTYNLPIGMNPRDVLKYLFQYTEEEYQKYSMKIFGKYNKDEWYRYITIASIVQKESGSKEEMTQVSGVIYNRLAKKMRLQMDGTLNYGEFSHTRVTPTMIANDESSYNTYKFGGIPTDPICAVEFSAIKAALFPAKNSYLFFMKNITGKGHSFATNYDSHKANIQEVVTTKKIEKANDTNKENTNKTKENKIPLEKEKNNKPQNVKNEFDPKQKPAKIPENSSKQKPSNDKKVYDKLHKETPKKENKQQNQTKELWKNI